ncbi:MAG: flavin reductase family protein [Candidatus Hodarchaeota archaeon]
MRRVSYPVNKKEWHPSLIPGPIVLISTYNARKEPNIAPISWLQMASFEPPILMFSTSKENTTAKNIIETSCFAVNLVDASIASKAFRCVSWYGHERIERTRFTMIEASRIYAPLVDECKANLECRLASTKEIGSGFVVFGEIIIASIWERILQVEYKKRYELLDQIVFLEDGMFSRINKISVVGD